MQMLVEATETTESNAAQVRVTPQELVQATAAIEARHHARAQQEAATIPIGEAVHQLNLEATPEEVLAEVQAQRNARMQTQQTSTKQKTHPKSVGILTVIVVTQFMVMAFLGWKLVAANQVNRRWRVDASRDYARIQELENAARNLTNVNQTVAQPAPQATLPTLRQLNPGLVHSLDIADGQTIACKFDTLERLAQGVKPAEVQTALHPSGTTWKLLRRGDKFFVQGWTTSQYAEMLMNGNNGLVYADENIDREKNPHIPITLPIEMFVGANATYTTDSTAGVWVTAAP